ncbi:MAG: hypothetical protein JST54_26070 [Deltaproteobacteria bacterium]|nr:hypothetical protein [Deltaproteobacteria bacterium]
MSGGYVPYAQPTRAANDALGDSARAEDAMSNASSVSAGANRFMRASHHGWRKRATECTFHAVLPSTHDATTPALRDAPRRLQLRDYQLLERKHERRHNGHRNFGQLRCQHQRHLELIDDFVELEHLVDNRQQRPGDALLALPR